MGKKNKAPVRKHPCPYCGRLTSGAYCQRCVREGWSEVHKMFGLTNGWDTNGKVRGQRPEIKARQRRSVRKTGDLVCGVWVTAGKKHAETVTKTKWRGHVVTGGKTALGRHST